MCYSEFNDIIDAIGALDYPNQIWVNPDCGVKTRTWDEVRPALINMVEAARQARSSAEEKPAPPSGR